MATRKKIEDQIAALQAEADAMGDDDEQFEVEIWNEKGEGARLPHSRSESWLKAKFPELFPDPPAEDPETEEGGTKPKAKQGQSKTPPGRTSAGTATKYFGKRQAGK